MSADRAWGQPLPGRLDVEPRGVDLVEARAMLTAAVDGLTLGAYDRRVIAWLSGWDQPTLATVASLLARARHDSPHSHGSHHSRGTDSCGGAP